MTRERRRQYMLLGETEECLGWAGAQGSGPRLEGNEIEMGLRSPWNGFGDPDGESEPSFPDGDSSLEEELESQVWPDACIDIPQHILDPCYFDLEVNTKERCFHGDVPERMVAFDMAATGRKFLSCPRKGDHRCSYAFWIDKAWNPVLTRTLIQLWNLAGSWGSDLFLQDGEVITQADLDSQKQSLPDRYFLGLEVDTEFRCLHGDVLGRKVAFDMAAIGRRFLGCPRKGAQSLPSILRCVIKHPSGRR